MRNNSKRIPIRLFGRDGEKRRIPDYCKRGTDPDSSNDGLKSMEAVFQSIHDTSATASALSTTYVNLNKLLDKES